LNNHRNQWTFVEREIVDSVNPPSHYRSVRGEYGPRESHNAVPLDQNAHSDSDMAGINDSEEDDDEDSNYGAIDNLELQSSVGHGPLQVLVEGAGNSAVNGLYQRDGVFEGACRYVMDGAWNSKRHKFYIFLCTVSNNTKHWYISIVPHGHSPGTSADIDFYSSPMTSNTQSLAPQTGWKAVKTPTPTLRFIYTTPK
jgi:hypothetical protein